MWQKKILVVDDEQSICDVIAIALRKEGYEVTVSVDPREALQIFSQVQFDLVVLDIKMPQIDGLELLRRFKQLQPEIMVIIITAFSTWDSAVQAMRLGAFDYIRKPFDTQLDLRATVERAFQFQTKQIELKDHLDETLERVGMMVGHSQQMKEVYNLIRMAAPTNSTVLIQGESGTGKELVARALHYTSPRANRPFITVNCGAFTETLLESELFGHVKGAFTGAIADKVGLLEIAHTGTFFLDEVSDMSPQLQVKFLRVLEEREFKPVGGVTHRRVEIRFITATNRNLEEEVKKRRFREDLFYRINVIPIVMPPLRHRKEDIPLLAGYFLSKFSKGMNKQVDHFSDRAMRVLMDYDWPGNVRELENIIQRAVALATKPEIDEIELFETLSKPPISQPVVPQQGIDLERLISDIEKGYLIEALKASDGNFTKAATLLRMSLRSFRYKMNKYGIKG
jgi:DNA-binding NtrC family response regulator